MLMHLVNRLKFLPILAYINAESEITKFSSSMAGLFGFDNFANLALQVNMIVYFSIVMHYDIASASNELTNFLGTSYILSVIASYIADTMWADTKLL